MCEVWGKFIAFGRWAGEDHTVRCYQSTLVLMAEPNPVLGGQWLCSVVASAMVVVRSMASGLDDGKRCGESSPCREISTQAVNEDIHSIKSPLIARGTPRQWPFLDPSFWGLAPRSYLRRPANSFETSLNTMFTAWKNHGLSHNSAVSTFTNKFVFYVQKCQMYQWG